MLPRLLQLQPCNNHITMHTQISAGISRILLIVLIAFAAIVLIVWFKGQAPIAGEQAIQTSRPAVVKPQPVQPIQPAATAPLINDTQELDAINVGDLDTEFGNVDADINSL